MSNKILCEDGISRSESQRLKWLRHLKSLYELEPGDLTSEEYEALLDSGMIDD